jgi:DNA-binding response OmpR family regulator
VDLYILWLRIKIEQRPAARSHLVTVGGVGYRLDAAGS